MTPINQLTDEELLDAFVDAVAWARAARLDNHTPAAIAARELQVAYAAEMTRRAGPN